MSILSLILKWAVTACFIFLGIYLVYIGVAYFKIPNVFLWLLSIALIMAGLCLVGSGFAVLFLWHFTWVRVAVAIIGLIFLSWLIYSYLERNDLENRAKQLVRNICSAEGLGTPHEYVFNDTYNADCGAYRFYLGQVNGNNRVIIARWGVDDDVYNDVFIPLDATPETAQKILSKLKQPQKAEQ